MHRKPPGWLARTSERAFTALQNGYGRTLRVVLDHPRLTMVVFLGTIILNIFLFATLYRVARLHDVHVIHVHNYEAPALAYVVRLLLGIPVVYHAHNLMSDELVHYFRRPATRGLALRVGAFLDRLVPRRANYVLALSKAMADGLRQNGVAADRIRPVSTARHQGRGRSDLRLLPRSDCDPARLERRR